MKTVRQLMPFKPAIALDQTAELVVCVDSDRVVIRVPSLDIRLFGNAAWARRVAAALVQMADLIDEFGEAEKNVEKRSAEPAPGPQQGPDVRLTDLDRMAAAGGFTGTQPPPAFSEVVDAPLWPWGEPERLPLTRQLADAVLAASDEPIAVSREFAAEYAQPGRLSSETIGWAKLALAEDGIRALITFHADPGDYRFAVPAVWSSATGQSHRVVSIGLTNNPSPGFKPMPPRSA
jgi:hypothetical protein